MSALIADRCAAGMVAGGVIQAQGAVTRTEYIVVSRWHSGRDKLNTLL